jgi:hypothetical protein
MNLEENLKMQEIKFSKAVQALDHELFKKCVITINTVKKNENKELAFMTIKVLFNFSSDSEFNSFIESINGIKTKFIKVFSRFGFESNGNLTVTKQDALKFGGDIFIDMIEYSYKRNESGRIIFEIAYGEEPVNY